MPKQNQISKQSKVVYDPVTRELVGEGIGVDELSELLDVSLSSPATGDVLEMQSNNKWSNSNKLKTLIQTVGDSTSGLVKDVTDISTDVSTLQTTVGDSNSGIVKDVSTLQTTVGNSNTGIVKDVNNLKTACFRLYTDVTRAMTVKVSSSSNTVTAEIKWSSEILDSENCCYEATLTAVTQLGKKYLKGEITPKNGFSNPEFISSLGCVIPLTVYDSSWNRYITPANVCKIFNSTSYKNEIWIEIPSDAQSTSMYSDPTIVYGTSDSNS